MAVAGRAKPSARLTLVNGNVVVDAFQMRIASILSYAQDKRVKDEDGEWTVVESATSRLLRGEQAFVQTYASNVEDVKKAVAAALKGNAKT